MDIYNDLQYLFKKIKNYKEISKMKKIQNDNFNLYLDSICPLQPLNTDLSNCQLSLNESEMYSLSKNSIPSKTPSSLYAKCANIKYEVDVCLRIRKELKKVFEIKQDKYLRDKYLS